MTSTSFSQITYASDADAGVECLRFICKHFKTVRDGIGVLDLLKKDCAIIVDQGRNWPEIYYIPDS